MSMKSELFFSILFARGDSYTTIEEFSVQSTESRFMSPIKVWLMIDFIEAICWICLLISDRFD